MPTKTPNKENLPLPKPEQITIAWLKQHVPLGWWWTLWASLIFLLCSSFSLGFAAGNWEPISAWVKKNFEKCSDVKCSKDNVDNSDSEYVSALSLRDHLREIREIVNCRIDLSSNLELDDQSPAEAAQSAQLIQGRKENIERLLTEINRTTAQIEQIASFHETGTVSSLGDLDRCP